MLLIKIVTILFILSVMELTKRYQDRFFL